MTDTVEWRTIASAPAYEVSSDGQVRRRLPPKRGGLKVGGVMRQHRDRNRGYWMLMLIGPNGERLTRAVHVLVCAAFHGPKPSPVHQVAHLNGNQNDNSKDNLIWATPKENSGHKYLHDTMPWGERTKNSKLTEAQVLEIRALKVRRYADLAEKYGVTSKTIGHVVRGDTWAHLPNAREAVRAGGAKWK